MKTKRIISVLLAVLVLSAIIPLSVISAAAGGPESYTVTFDPNGGEGEMDSMTAEQGKPFKLPWPEFTPPRGKTFDCWDLGKPGEYLNIMSNTELVAQWADCDELEIIVCDTNGNEGVGGTVSIGEEWDTHLIEKYSQTYFPTVNLSAKADEDYTFVGFQNSMGYSYSTDNPWSFTRPDSPLFKIYAVFEKTAPTLISQIECDLLLPYVGTAYDDSVGGQASVDVLANYYIQYAFWYDVETDTAPEEFIKGKEYYAQIIIVCKDKYAFADKDNLLITVNGFKPADFMIMGTTISIKTGVYIPTDYPPILGDADNDGKISVLDATTIQKKLASLITDTSGRIAYCGDVSKDGLDITDATYIQKYLAHIPVPYKIGDPMA